MTKFNGVSKHWYCFLSIKKKAPNSDSVADATMFLIILLSTYMGPLSGGDFCCSNKGVPILSLK